MLKKFNKVRISAIQGLLGRETADLEAELAKCGVDQRRIHRLLKISGFKKISVVPPDKCVGDLCVSCAVQMLETMGVDPKSIDALLLVTQTPDYLIPPTTYTIQERIGLSGDCLLLDLIQGCPGYVNGLLMACSLVEGGQCHRVLLCNGEISFHTGAGLTNPEAALEAADGCTVTLIERDDAASPMFFSVKNFGELHRVVMNRNYGIHAARVPGDNGNYEVDGIGMNSFVLDKVSAHIRQFLSSKELSGIKPELIVAQQTSKTMLEALAVLLNMGPDFIPFEAELFGNVSSASIPLTISMLENKRKAKTKSPMTLMAGFGVGLCSALGLCDLRHARILPLIRI